MFAAQLAYRPYWIRGWACHNVKIEELKSDAVETFQCIIDVYIHTDSPFGLCMSWVNAKEVTCKSVCSNHGFISRLDEESGKLATSITRPGKYVPRCDTWECMALSGSLYDPFVNLCPYVRNLITMGLSYSLHMAGYAYRCLGPNVNAKCDLIGAWFHLLKHLQRHGED